MQVGSNWSIFSTEGPIFLHVLGLFSNTNTSNASFCVCTKVSYYCHEFGPFLVPFFGHLGLKQDQNGPFFTPTDPFLTRFWAAFPLLVPQMHPLMSVLSPPNGLNPRYTTKTPKSVRWPFLPIFIHFYPFLPIFNPQNGPLKMAGQKKAAPPGICFCIRIKSQSFFWAKNTVLRCAS